MISRGVWGSNLTTWFQKQSFEGDWKSFSGGESDPSSDLRREYLYKLFNSIFGHRFNAADSNDEQQDTIVLSPSKRLVFDYMTFPAQCLQFGPSIEIDMPPSAISLEDMTASFINRGPFKVTLMQDRTQHLKIVKRAVLVFWDGDPKICPELQGTKTLGWSKTHTLRR